MIIKKALNYCVSLDKEYEFMYFIVNNFYCHKLLNHKPRFCIQRKLYIWELFTDKLFITLRKKDEIPDSENQAKKN